MIQKFDNELEEIDKEDPREESVVEEIKHSQPKRKKLKINKKTLDSMIEKASSMIIEDHVSVLEDGLLQDHQENKNLDEEEEEGDKMDFKLSNFRFEHPKPRTFTKQLGDEMGKMKMVLNDRQNTDQHKSDQIHTYFSQGKQKATDADIDAYTFAKTTKKPQRGNKAKILYENFNTELKSDDHDPANFKFWIEVYDEERKKWFHVDPLKKVVYKGNEEIDKKLSNMPGLFVISFAPYDLRESYNNCQNHSPHKMYLRDLTARYIPRWHKVLVSRKQVGLDKWWRQITTYYNFEQHISSLKSVLINRIEDRELARKCKEDLPQNIKEFRVSEHYTLNSLLKKYQGLKVTSQPMQIKFKDEDIYMRSDIEELHSRSKWMRYGRKVRKGEQPRKRVVAIAANEERLVDLYSEWQTDTFENTITEDGLLPRNDYGNYELWGHDIPEGTAYVQALPGLVRLCKNLEVEYVECVVGKLILEIQRHNEIRF